jgi:desulfoferrodoxin (superoxide reductase-like protein)
MKTILAVFILVALPLTVLFAHPASSIKADYKAADKSLAVNVTHLISKSKNTDPTKHFIKEISVTLNGTLVEKKTFTSQTGDNQITSFALNAKKGDKVNIVAVCSLAGTKTASIVIK